MILAWLAAAFIVGVLTGSEILSPGLPWLVSLAPGTALLLLLWRRRRMRTLILIGLALALGAGRFEATRTVVGPDTLSFYNGRSLELTGVITSEPDIRDRVSYFVVLVDHVAGRGVAPKVSGQLELCVASSQILNAGDRLNLSGFLRTPLDTPTAPIKSILAHRGIFSEMSFPRTMVVGHTSLGASGVALGIRQTIERSINTALPDPEAALLIAILIGAKTAQLGTLAPVLIKTGLIHLIAISGIKIAIVAGTVHSFLRRTTSRTPTLALSGITVLSYWLVSGATIAGLRASIMWLLVFTAVYLGRSTLAPVSLAIAAAVMVAVNPGVLWDTGFQLSTLATLSIVAFAPTFERALRFMPAAFCASISTTSAAQIGILPLQVASYGLVSPSSIIANGLVLPLIPFTMIIGFLTALVPLRSVAAVSYSMVHLVIWIAEVCSRLPFAWLALGALPMSLAASYYLLAALLGVLAWRLPSRPSRANHGQLLIGLIVATAALWVTEAGAQQSNQIAFVANGAALFSVDGDNILIDGGSSPQALLSGLGTSLPFSDRRIDVMIDTEPGSRNVASLQSVVDRYQVSLVLDPGIEYPTNTYARWMHSVSAHRIPFLGLRAGATVTVGRVTIEVLSPYRTFSNAKDGAGVLRVTVGHERLLYVGQLSARGQRDLPYSRDLRAPTVISAAALSPALAGAIGALRIVTPRAGTRMGLR